MYNPKENLIARLDVQVLLSVEPLVVEKLLIKNLARHQVYTGIWLLCMEPNLPREGGFD